MFESKINRGKANGYAPLDGDGKVSLSNLPDVVGVAGTSGTSGINGSQGLNGTSGGNGTSGVDGTSGTSPFAGVNTGSFATTGSNTFIGNQIITGSLTVSGSNTFTNIGRTELTGSVEVDGDVGVYGNITVVQKTIEVLGFPSEQPAFYSEGDILLSGSLSIHVEELGQSFDVAEQFQQAFSSISFTQGEIEIISSSYATTGSNTFVGNQTISGSLVLTGSLTSSKVLTDAVRFNTSAGVSVGVGELAWNNSDGTLDLGMKGGNVVQQIGQEIFYEVRNETGIQIPNGTAVFANGVTAGSGRITVAPYTADGSVREVRFLGLATENISTGVNGFVTYFGYVRGLDTRGNVVSSIAVGDETWAVGDILYVHPTVAGKLTNVKPEHAITVAIIITRHQSVGVVFVRPSTGGHLEDIHDILINTGSLTNGQILSYNSASGLWENANQINTSSFATTGSNSFIGNQTITGSIQLSDSIKGTSDLPIIISSSVTIGALTFDGTNYLTLSPGIVVGSGAYTAETFVYISDYSGVRYVVLAASTPGGSGFSFGILSTNQIFVDRDGVSSNIYAFASTFPLNEWYHIAVTKNSAGQETVFVNGVKSTSSYGTDVNYSGTTEAIGRFNESVWLMSGSLSQIRLVVGSNVYDPTVSTINVPTTTLTNVSNTQLLLNVATAETYLDDTSGNQTVTNNNSVSFNSNGPLTTQSNVEFTFGQNGTLVFPDETIQSTAFTGLNQDIVSSSQQILDYGIFATTGSNTFVGNQTISGSLMISGSGSLNGSNIVSSNTIMKIETISSASYAALTPPVSGTLYIII